MYWRGTVTCFKRCGGGALQVTQKVEELKYGEATYIELQERIRSLTHVVAAEEQGQYCQFSVLPALTCLK